MRFAVNILLISALLILGMACQSTDQQETASTLTSSEWIRNAISHHGGEAYQQAEISLDFRDIHYTAELNHGAFTYTRTFSREGQTFHDQLNNDGFIRFIDDQIAAVPDSMATKYSASVNSVWYFALLPYGLDNPAVISKDLGRVEIKGAPYQKIEVRFKEEGGGEDFEDVFPTEQSWTICC
ncbi:MAG: DUF6503 family protein [Bacteroidota bacterium]